MRIRGNWRLSLVFPVAFVAMSVASYGQKSEPAKTIQLDRNVVLTKFAEARENKAFREIIRIYEQQIADRIKEFEGKQVELRYQYAEALFAVNKRQSRKLGKCQGVLEQILQENEGHIEARFQLALVLAYRGSKANESEFIYCAAHGVPVLRLMKLKEPQIYQSMLQSPRLIREIVRPKNFALSRIQVKYDPFKKPFGSNLARQREWLKRQRERQELEEQFKEELKAIDKLFQKLDLAVQNEDVSVLKAGLSEINQRFKALELWPGREFLRGQLEQKIADFKAKFKAERYKNVLQTLQLQAMVGQGRGLLQKMSQQLRAKTFREVATTKGRLEAIIGKIERTDHKSASQYAAIFSKQGAQIAKEALTRQWIMELNLKVTGIVIAGADNETAKSNDRGALNGDRVIVNDRVFGPGETVYMSTKSGQEVKLSILKIGKHSVQFQLNDIQFQKSLFGA